MLSPAYFVNELKKSNIDFFSGVPDSLLKSFCAYISDFCPKDKNIITANEGGAVGLAAGYYLATSNIPVVYMQNSGVGNTVNPLVSLMDKEVYNIPVLLLVGWRGEPGIKDEPQHIKQGKITIPLLDIMGIKNEILSKEESVFSIQLKVALEYMQQTKEPYAFVIEKNTFSEYKMTKMSDDCQKMSREEALSLVVSSTGKEDVIIATTGMISRELFEYREFFKEIHDRDFLTVGSMGHASQIALGIALSKKNRQTYCFDGDGALLMHMGALAIIGNMKPQNYIHILFNNGAHDSVGGQPTVALKMNWVDVAISCGYNCAFTVDNKDSLVEVLEEIKTISGPIFIEIKVKKGARINLGRPTTTTIENKTNLMAFLK